MGPWQSMSALSLLKTGMMNGDVHALLMSTMSCSVWLWSSYLSVSPIVRETKFSLVSLSHVSLTSPSMSLLYT